MKKLAGIALFLLLVYAADLLSGPAARSLANHRNVGNLIGLFSILSLAAGMLMITGGIDLSMGSLVGLCSTLLAMLMTRGGLRPSFALALILVFGALIGLCHGLLVTKLKLQAFIVTLCGLFIYRGAAKWVAGDADQGLGSRFGPLKEILTEDFFNIPVSLLIFAALALLATVFLHMSKFGRYFYAIGSNEKAARYSGIATDRYKIIAYVMCSTLTAFFSFLHLMQNNSAQPASTGNLFELYAIAGAVMGGVSLRGGEGTVLGILIGTCIVRILPNMITMWAISSTVEYLVMGAALLLGAAVDEVVRRSRRTDY